MSRISGLAEQIRLQILRGQVAPGERLVELHIAQRYRVGRPAIREALRRLEGEGLVVANDGGGMRVRPIDALDLADALQVRASLEELAAGLAARRVATGRVPTADLDRRRVLVEAAEAASAQDVEAQLLADRHLHRSLAGLSRNSACEEALTRVWDRIFVAAVHDVPGSAAIAARPSAHRPLLSAIASGEAEAASALAREHVLAALDLRSEHSAPLAATDRGA